MHRITKPFPGSSVATVMGRRVSLPTDSNEQLAPLRSEPRSPLALPQVIVIDTIGRVLEATSGGHALLAESKLLRCSFDHLAAATQSSCNKLAAAISTALAAGHASQVFENHEQRLDVEFFALRSEAEANIHIVMILRETHSVPPSHLHSMQETFGLTPAESRLLGILYAGSSVPQAARLLGVARTTARTHLQRVFDKTGVRRQQDLMRVVAGG